MNKFRKNITYKHNLSFIIITCVVVIISVISQKMLTSYATTNYFGSTDEAVHICKVLNILKGTSSKGLTDDYLKSVPMRYQGATMLLRLKDLENEALSYSYANNFKDVNTLSWKQGRNILGYLYVNQNSIGFRGYTDQTFRPNSEMTAKQYYKLMLVALGYREDFDFTWSGNTQLPSIEKLAKQLGLYRAMQSNKFTIENLALATVEALRAEVKTGDKSLADTLVEKKVIKALFAKNMNLSLLQQSSNTTQNNSPITTKSTTETTTQVQKSVTTSPAIPPVQIGVSLDIKNNYEIDALYGKGTMLTITLSGGEFIGDIETNAFLAKSLINNIKKSSDLDWEKKYAGTEKDISKIKTNQVQLKLNYGLIEEDKILNIKIPSEIIKDYDKPLEAGNVTIYDSGNGTRTKPYLLFNARHFSYLNQLPSYVNINLMNDIDMKDYSNFVGIAAYLGNFDGKGHTISNLSLTTSHTVSYMGRPSQKCLGLFGYLIDNGNVCNVTFDKAVVAQEGVDTHYSGVVTGYMEKSTINNVNITNCRIANQFNDTTAFSYTGGLVGRSNSSTLTDIAVNNCNISNRSKKGKVFVGGLCGLADDGTTIKNTSVLKSEIMLNKNFEETKSYIPKAGGITGGTLYNVLIDNCSFEGHVKGLGAVGGIAGYKDYNALMVNGCTVEGTLENYSTYEESNIPRGATGGIVGMTTDLKCTIIACKADINRYIIHHRKPVAIHRIVAIPSDRTQLTLDRNNANPASGIYLINIDSQSNDMMAWVKQPLTGNEDQDAEIIASEIFNDRTKNGLDGEDQ